MATPLTGPSPNGFLGPDPGRGIRVWVTLLLRLGIGLSMLNTGLVGYYGMQSGRGGGMMWGQGPSMAMLDPFMSGLPYLAIAIGLALILGFLTTASAIGAGFASLVMPVLTLVQVVMSGSSGGMNIGGRFGTDQYFALMMMMSLPNLLINAAMIWLSPLENNPYSVDALIFGRNEMEPSALMTGPIPGPERAVEEEAPIRIEE